MAAGLSLPEENVDPFRRKINEITTLSDKDLREKIVIDVPMPLDYINRSLIEELSLLEPFGKANEKPVFADRNIRILSMRILGKNQNVCRMQVQSAGGGQFAALYFGQVEQFVEYLRGKYGSKLVEQAFAAKGGEMLISFVYYPEINRYNGRESIQIVVKNYH